MPIPTAPLPLTNNIPLPPAPFTFNKLAAVLLLNSNKAVGLVVPIPTLPVPMNLTRSTGATPAASFNENAKSMLVLVRIASMNTFPPLALLNGSDVAAAKTLTVVPAVVSKFIALMDSNIPPATVFIKCIEPSAILVSEVV